MPSIELPAGDRAWLRLQRMAGWATFAVVGPGSVFAMRVVRNTRVHGVEEARRVYRQALASGRPTIVCANHLTMVDSAYLHWALAPISEYLLHFERFSWNVAAFEHFKDNPFLRTIVFLAKTVPIDRGDETHRKAVLDKIRWLASRGEVLTLFPEGARSRSGRIDPSAVTYGVGQILKELERPQVLCAYLRGRRQASMSSVPAFGDTMDLRVELLEPATSEKGLRAARDLSRQVITKLKSMEDAYLASRNTEAAPARDGASVVNR
jgi:1-acyl-sn-glycerol-3-phosphate acyltransferase